MAGSSSPPGHHAVPGRPGGRAQIQPKLPGQCRPERGQPVVAAKPAQDAPEGEHGDHARHDGTAAVGLGPWRHGDQAGGDVGARRDRDRGRAREGHGACRRRERGPADASASGLGHQPGQERLPGPAHVDVARVGEHLERRTADAAQRADHVLPCLLLESRQPGASRSEASRSEASLPDVCLPGVRLSRCRERNLPARGTSARGQESPRREIQNRALVGLGARHALAQDDADQGRWQVGRPEAAWNPGWNRSAAPRAARRPDDGRQPSAAADHQRSRDDQRR
jgi:hypothetical protein